MTDDIVTRLRAIPEKRQDVSFGIWTTATNPYFEELQEAADEIERLRRVAYSMAQTLEINGKWLDVDENDEYVPMKADAILLDFYEDEKAWANEK